MVNSIDLVIVVLVRFEKQEVVLCGLCVVGGLDDVGLVVGLEKIVVKWWDIEGIGGVINKFGLISKEVCENVLQLGNVFLIGNWWVVVYNIVEIGVNVGGVVFGVVGVLVLIGLLVVVIGGLSVVYFVGQC